MHLNILFTMSNSLAIGLALLQGISVKTLTKHKVVNGGGGRDRTDDLKLAKLPLSQLSYAPDMVFTHICLKAWWAWLDSN